MPSNKTVDTQVSDAACQGSLPSVNKYFKLIFAFDVSPDLPQFAVGHFDGPVHGGTVSLLPVQSIGIFDKLQF